MAWPELTRIDPVFRPRLWGACTLAPLFPEQSGLAQPVGEAWLTALDCRIASGPYAGRDLQEAWQEMDPRWRGTRLAAAAQFPLLVKFLFPTDKLSIQVHPTDAYAAAYEQAAGGRGKTEMWHALSAGPEARVLVGLKPGASKEKFLAALAAHQLEDLLESRSVHPGDTFFVPPGTPHTIGPGMILCEVQEYSDLTYRVYDYGRVDDAGQPRELHLEKALAVMNFGKIAGGKIALLPLPARGMKKSLLAACKYFAAERWEFAQAAELLTNQEHFNLLVILSGSGEINCRDAMEPYLRGQAWFLPAALDSPRIIPAEPTTLLRIYVPDLPALRNRLRDAGENDAAISTVVFE
ncbi:MAG: class I mannose-6-phosphate isomerase [Acidobacteriia bacterium]|nr:class I mannose-6-phosphate isomerase [Terriglobia bacterium]